MHSVSDGPPSCLICGRETVLLYPSNVPPDQRLDASEFACTSPHLSVHDDIYHCRSCGLARSVPGSDIESIEDLYRNVEDDGYLESEEERRLDYRRALESFDRELVELEERYPDLVDPGSPTQRVHGAPLDGLEPFAHEHPMLSLSNVFSDEELGDFDRRVRDRLKWPAGEQIDYVAEPKLDGLAVSLQVNKNCRVGTGHESLGQQRRAAIRGDSMGIEPAFAKRALHPDNEILDVVGIHGVIG